MADRAVANLKTLGFRSPHYAHDSLECRVQTYHCSEIASSDTKSQGIQETGKVNVNRLCGIPFQSTPPPAATPSRHSASQSTYNKSSTLNFRLPPLPLVTPPCLPIQTQRALYNVEIFIPEDVLRVFHVFRRLAAHVFLPRVT